MKSERRHDLKTNTLSQQLEGLPDYWREYGNKILLVIIVGLLVYIAVRYYRDKKARDLEQVSVAMETIRTSMRELDQLQVAEAMGSPASDARQKVSSTINDSISTVLSTSKDPKVLARAYIAQGDLDWKLANMPDPPGATTRPDLKISNRDGLLGGAAESYSKVLEAPYSSDPLSVVTARMGLAAVAENRGKWDEAKSQYQAIVDAKNLSQAFKDIAAKRLTDLADYKSIPLLNPPPEAGATNATTAPSIFGPEAPMFPNATTAPSTMPGPTTIPALPTPSPTTGPVPATQP